MKLKEALEIINKGEYGYIVGFSYFTNLSFGDMVGWDHFPEVFKGESPIQTETEAIELAEKFSGATRGRYFNIYVVDTNFIPIEGYKIYNLKKTY